jgi:segregation and condensation protein B
MKQPEVQSAPEMEGAIPEELLRDSPLSAADSADAQLKALVEAVIYITDEPLSADQIAIALGQPAEKIGRVLEELTAEYNKPEHGLTIREIAGGYKMSTKPEHHEAVRAFVKNLKPALKLSLAALETLALIAYKQPITAPEIMEVRGVQGAGVLKTLLDRKLIATGGRKQVVGKPILYKTTKEFLVQFGLKDLSELPTLKEFEDLSRLSVAEGEPETVERTEASTEETTELALEMNEEPQAEPSE